MGMAASQARYLALTARKTNIEYEGQQINQARTALANQSANLFNQMLSMSVPTPPSTTDFTTIQYSFSDGVNTEVLSNYYQLGNADSDYNYVVTTYHNEKVFTGSRKKMNDPQIQTTWANNYSYSPSSVDNNSSTSVTKAVLQSDGTYFIQGTDGTSKTFRAVTLKDEDQVRAINKGYGHTLTSATADLRNTDVRNTYQIVDGNTQAQLEELGSIFGYSQKINDVALTNFQSADWTQVSADQLAAATSIYGNSIDVQVDLTGLTAGTNAAGIDVFENADGSVEYVPVSSLAADSDDMKAFTDIFGANASADDYYYDSTNGIFVSTADILDHNAAATGTRLAKEADFITRTADGVEYFLTAADKPVDGEDYTAKSVTATKEINSSNVDTFRAINTNDADEVAQAIAALGLPADISMDELADYMFFAATSPSAQGFIEKADYDAYLSGTGNQAVFYQVDDFSDEYYWNGTGYVSAEDMDNYAADAAIYYAGDEGPGQGINTTGDQTYYTDGKTFVTKADLDSAVSAYNRFVETGKKEANTIQEMNVTNNPTFSNYTAIGNCHLTELTAADIDGNEDIAAEIDQIIKDMFGENGDIIAAQNLEACFDVDSQGNRIYKGGLYQFQMGGVTYYTTKADLDASAGTSIVDNEIDVQQEKLRYYNAIYVDTKVEDTQKALLETDGAGRFKTVRFENDNVSYVLNTETVTDEDAYNDAMNRYYYENAQYEKMIEDINAKTEIIHAQDRTLELRLEQLETEQSALQNEMEAVKKVVNKNIENGFKTFGG